jgi:DNA ligase-4
MRIISDFSAREQMWLMRIILKELKIGLRQETVLKHFHPQAPEVYNSSADLNQVCEFVLDPKNRSNLLQIDLFKPVRVMLAAVVDWDKIIHVMKGVRLGIEIKFDGERIQVHKKGNELKFFTRNSKDFTNQHGYRDVMGPHIIANVKADTCILDGELVTWDPVAQSYGQFGSNRTVSLRQASTISESQLLGEQAEEVTPNSQGNSVPIFECLLI